MFFWINLLFSERLFIGCVLLDPPPDKPELFSDNARKTFINMIEFGWWVFMQMRVPLPVSDLDSTFP